MQAHLRSPRCLQKTHNNSHNNVHKLTDTYYIKPMKKPTDTNTSINYKHKYEA